MDGVEAPQVIAVGALAGLTNYRRGQLDPRVPLPVTIELSDAFAVALPSGRALAEKSCERPPGLRVGNDRRGNDFRILDKRANTR